MAEAISLEVKARDLVGKKVKRLRKEGIVPANIFGAGIKSTSIQVNFKDFVAVYSQVGETGLVELKEGSNTHPVLVHQIQKEPKGDTVLHIDFHQVNLKEKTTANVPVVLIGESPIEKSKAGIVLQSMTEVEVEALPTDIPHNIEINIETLIEVGQTIHVKDLKVEKSKVEIKTDPEAIVVTVQTAEIKEEEPVVEASTEVEVIGEKAVGEETAAEGDKAPEADSKPDDKSKE